MVPTDGSCRSPSAVKSPCASILTWWLSCRARLATLPPWMLALPPSSVVEVSCRLNPFSLNSTLPWLWASKGESGEMRISLPCRATAPLTMALSICMMGSPRASEISALPLADACSRLLPMISDRGDWLVSASACSSGPCILAAMPTVRLFARSGMCADRSLTSISGALLKRAVAFSTESDDLSMTSRPLSLVSAGQGFSPAFCR